MSDSKHLHPVQQGLLICCGRLRGWGERIHRRLHAIESNCLQSRAAFQFFRETESRVKRALDQLDCLPAKIRALREQDRKAVEAIDTALLFAEMGIRDADIVRLPILLTRTRSDPKYDAFLLRLFHELKMDFLPVTTHLKQDVSGGLKLEMLSRTSTLPIIHFTPSTRSFDALSLVFHECGHLYFMRLLESADAASLLGYLLPLCRNHSARPVSGAHDDAATLLKQGYPELWDAREEIFADAFAGLVGGRAYAINLCSLLLCHEDLHASSDPHYPPPAWRVWLSRLACRVGEGAELGDGPTFTAWETAQARRRRSVSAGPLLLHEPEALQFLTAFADTLRRAGIPLASDVQHHAVSNPPNLDCRSLGVRQLLHVAANYRESLGGQWAEYAGWERRVFPKVGLPRESLKEVWLRLLDASCSPLRKIGLLGKG